LSKPATSSLAVLAAALLVSCGGGSTPPPEDASGRRPPGSSGAGRGGAGEPGATDPAGTALPPGHPPLASSSDAAASSTAAVAGTIALGAAVEGRVSPSDVLYVMAKKDGATLAARRVDQPRFPFAFEISGADTMVAGAALEGPVDVVARLSKSGDAIPGAGDLEGTTTGVAVPARGVAVTIDRVRE